MTRRNYSLQAMSNKNSFVSVRGPCLLFVRLHFWWAVSCLTDTWLWLFCLLLFFNSYEIVRMKLLSFHKVQFHVYRRFHVWSTSESILFRIIIKVSCLLNTWKWSLSFSFFFIVMKLSEWSWIPFTRCSFTFIGVFMFYQQVRLFFFLIIIELVNINLHCIYNAIRCIFHNLVDTKENCIKPITLYE